MGLLWVTGMNRLGAALAVVSVLAGCAAEPDEFYGPPGAPPGAMDRAYASCKAQSDQVAVGAIGQGAMFAAAMQGQYINDCMAAAGYRRP